MRTVRLKVGNWLLIILSKIFLKDCQWGEWSSHCHCSSEHSGYLRRYRQKALYENEYGQCPGSDRDDGDCTEDCPKSKHKNRITLTFQVHIYSTTHTQF